jgi:hypothetical protein
MVTVSCHTEACRNEITCYKMAEQMSLMKTNQGTYPQPLKETVNKSLLILDNRMITIAEVTNQVQISHGCT